MLLPLTMGDEFVAAMVVCRTKPLPFAPDEVAILEDVARPVATAVANALAFEEIQKLRSQLEDENVALREEIAATAGRRAGSSELPQDCARCWSGSHPWRRPTRPC